MTTIFKLWYNASDDFTYLKFLNGDDKPYDHILIDEYVRLDLLKKLIVDLGHHGFNTTMPPLTTATGKESFALFHLIWSLVVVVLLWCIVGLIVHQKRRNFVRTKNEEGSVPSGVDKDGFDDGMDMGEAMVREETNALFTDLIDDCHPRFSSDLFTSIRRINTEESRYGEVTFHSCHRFDFLSLIYA